VLSSQYCDEIILDATTIGKATGTKTETTVMASVMSKAGAAATGLVPGYGGNRLEILGVMAGIMVGVAGFVL